MCCKRLSDSCNKRRLRMKKKINNNHDITSNGVVSSTPNNRSNTPSSSKATITNLSASASSARPEHPVMVQEGQQCTRALQCDVATGTCDTNVMTDMDLLGPCEPGTSVVLEGIVWSESNNGILVVNVTWRGKTYVGTLMDATRHHWAPPRYRDDSPVMDLDWKSPKYRNVRNANNSNNDATLVEGRRLRKCRRNNNSTVNSLRSQSTRQSPTFNNDATTASVGGRRRPRTAVDNNQPADSDSPVPAKKAKESKPESESPQMWECHEGTCGKKFKHATGLKYHQTHVHRKLPPVVVNGNVVEELKETSPPFSQEISNLSNKKTNKKSSRNGTPELNMKSESTSPVAEIVNAFSGVAFPNCDKTDLKYFSDVDKLTPKSMTPELETCSSPAVPNAQEVSETTRPAKKRYAETPVDDSFKNCDVKNEINKLTLSTSNSVEVGCAAHSSFTESRIPRSLSPVNVAENRSVTNAAGETSKTPTLNCFEDPARHTPVDQDVPLNCKTSPHAPQLAPMESVTPEKICKNEPTTPTGQMKLQPMKDIKTESETLKQEVDKTPSGQRNKESPFPWRDRMPPLIPQSSTSSATFPPSMFGFGIDPMYHMQLMSASPEYRVQFERWLAEQHYRQMYRRFDTDKHSTADAKPVDMTLKSSSVNSNLSSSQDQYKSQKKNETVKKPVVSNNTSSNNNNSNLNYTSSNSSNNNFDKKLHSNKKMPPPVSPATPQYGDDKRRLSGFINFKSERPDSRHHDLLPAQSMKATTRSHHRESDVPLFQQNPFSFSSPQPLKMPYDFPPSFHGSPFLDPAATQVSLSRPPSHFMEKSNQPDMSLKNGANKDQAKSLSGKRSVDASDDPHKESSSKDKSAPSVSSLGGHTSPLTLRHLHTHHHTHVLGPAYSLYGSYNGLVPPVPPLVTPVVPVITPSFIPK